MSPDGGMDGARVQSSSEKRNSTEPILDRYREPIRTGAEVIGGTGNISPNGYQAGNNRLLMNEKMH